MTVNYMKKPLLSCIFALTALASAADERMLFDFENYQTGDMIAMRDLFSSTTESTAEVTADPLNAGNKVLHVTNRSWNTHVELPLDGIGADELTGDYQYIAFDLYRPVSDTDRYKQLSIRIGNDTVYADDGFYDQGDAGQWLGKTYRMKRVSSSSDKLYFGFNSINAEFYIDNVRIISTEEDYDPTDPEQTLRYHADKCGKKIGVAVPAWRIDLNDDNQDITRTIYSNFNMVVAENEMKIDALQPNRGEFNFYSADQLTAFAARHGMDVRGHTLVWHSQVPAWISADGKKNDKGYSRAEMLQIMKDHITTVMTHFKGKVTEWDVVNECLDDDQSAIRTNPSGYTLRKSVWLAAIGDDYLDSAFVYAHRADPEARLYINDYGVEMTGSAKTQAYYNLVKQLQKRGAPIDGVGLQCHLTVGELDSTAFANNVKRYAALGLNCIVTELDISIPDVGDGSVYLKQAEEYRIVTNVMLNNGHCPNLLVWGVKDDMSWRAGEPLLFSSQLAAKPAFFAMRNAYAGYAATTGINVAPAIAPPAALADVYDLGGRPVGKGLTRQQVNSLPKGLYIVNGKVTVVK